MDTRRISLRIRGKVQGVFFRESARREAERLGLAGWVRNRSDGSVEALVEGPAERLAAFQAWCREGPPAARVDGVELADPAPDAPLGPDFRVERSL